MRVLHLTSEYPPLIWGGLGTAVGGLTVASAQAGLTVDVLLVRHAGEPGLAAMSYGQQIVHSSSAAPAQGRARIDAVTLYTVAHANAEQQAVALAQRLRPDVIHIHPVELWPVARAIHAALGTPIVYTVHSLNLAEYIVGQEPPEILNLWHTQQELLDGATQVIVLTQDERDLLLQACPQVRNRVHIVGNGIDDHALARQVAFRPKKRSAPLVLYSGRFVERKGIHDLFAAIPRVLELAPETRFVLVGGYGCGAAVEHAWLPSTLADKRNQLHFTGWLKPAQVAEWYAAADILVTPSWYEPFGMVILEGMLYGLPIVATNIGGPAAILEDGHTGLLVPPRNAERLAVALIQLVQNRALRQQLGAAAAVAVRRNWLWSQVVKQIITIYHE